MLLYILSAAFLTPTNSIVTLCKFLLTFFNKLHFTVTYFLFVLTLIPSVL